MDTPGIRGLELWNFEGKIEPDFGDIEALSSQCRFRNCQHGREPDCAVRDAVDRGDLDRARLAAFARPSPRFGGRSEAATIKTLWR